MSAVAYHPRSMNLETIERRYVIDLGPERLLLCDRFTWVTFRRDLRIGSRARPSKMARLPPALRREASP
jgi:hypothetical protein